MMPLTTHGATLHALRSAAAGLGLALVLAGCQGSSGGSSDPGTVSLAVSVNWPAEASAPSMYGAAPMAVQPSDVHPLIAPPGVANMKATITVGPYSSTKKTPAGTGSDSISNVPPGAGTLELDALDSGDAVLYSGTSGFTGDANATVPVTVDMTVAPTAKVAPWPPTGVTAIATGTAAAPTVTLTWNPSSGATSYNAYRATATGVGLGGSKFVGVKSGLVDNGLTTGTAYYYVVTALNGTLESGASAEATATTLGTAPPASTTTTTTTTTSPTPGTLDTTFNSPNGFAVSAGSGSNAVVNGIAVDKSGGANNGKIYLVGYSTAGGVQSMTLWRYNADGSPDNTFTGTAPNWITQSGFGLPSVGNAVTVDSTGRIIVVGQSVTASTAAGNCTANSLSGYCMTVWRLTSNGVPDTGFAPSGFAGIIPSTGSITAKAVGNALAIDSGGNIVIVGQSHVAAPGDVMTIWRYKPGTGFDATLAGGLACSALSVTIEAPGENTTGNAVVIDGSGRIVVVGTDAATSKMVWWRYTPGICTTGGAGTFDKLGPTNQYVIDTAGGSSATGKAVTLDSSGNILIAGQSGFGMALWRFVPTTTGSPDTTFGSPNGYVTYTPPQGTGASGAAIAYANSGNKIIVAGSSTKSLPAGATVWRFSNTGAADTTFGSNGIFFQDATQTSSTDNGNALVLDSSGNILLGGYSSVSSVKSAAVWRVAP